MIRLKIWTRTEIYFHLYFADFALVISAHTAQNYLISPRVNPLTRVSLCYMIGFTVVRHRILVFVTKPVDFYPSRGEASAAPRDATGL